MNDRLTVFLRVTGALALALLTLATPRAARAQWTGVLIIDPLPSPYISDWEIDPSLGDLTVTNLTATGADVRFHYTLTLDGALVLRGVTDRFAFLPGETRVFDSSIEIGGEADWNTAFEGTIVATGRLPEGEYEGCVSVVDPNGLVLVDNVCAGFSTLYPDPPGLVFPFDGDTITTPDPIFEWLPVHLPAFEGFRTGYVFELAAVAPGQLPEVALASNILHHLETDLGDPSFPYSVAALPLEDGRRYAWQVQALDGDGAPVAANHGRSEVWTFVYRELAVDVEPDVAYVEVTPRSDTLGGVGDTVRYLATAYDANGFEIPGYAFDWRSIDTSVAVVDSSGVVRSVGMGTARIVAATPGAADTASTVVPAPDDLVAGLSFYDADTENPSLWELVESGSHADVVPQLTSRLGSGNFEVPVPMAYRAETASASASSGCVRADRSPVDFASSDDGTSFAVRFDLPIGRLRTIMECLKVSEWSSDDGPPGNAGASITRIPALWVVSWEHPGLPRTYLALKLPARTVLGGRATREAAYIVINPLRAVEIDSAGVPAEYSWFFGGNEFPAGVGATYFSRVAFDSTTVVGRVLDWLGHDETYLTLRGFIGLTASVSRLSTSGDAATVNAPGISLVASLPPKPVPDWVPLVQEQQFSLEVTFSDSLVTTRDSTQHNVSLAVKPRLTWAMQGPAGNDFEVTASIGMVSDGMLPQLVIEGGLNAVLELGVFRIGNPLIIMTIPAQRRRDENNKPSSLAISGTWGFGRSGSPGCLIVPMLVDTADCFALSSDNEGGFEELGRGAVTFDWRRLSAMPNAVAPARRNLERGQRAVGEAERDVRIATASLDYAKEQQALRETEFTAAMRPTSETSLSADERRAAINAATSALREANEEVTSWTARLDADRQKLTQLQQNLATAEASLEDAGMSESTAALRRSEEREVCKGKIMADRCFTVGLSISIGNGSLADILAGLVRLAPGPARE